MKKGIRILLKVLAGLLIVLLAALAAMQSPRIQSWVGGKVVDRLRDSMDADITFKMVAIRPFEAITLDDVTVIDRNPSAPGADTIAAIGSLAAKFSLMGLLDGSGAYLSHARLEDASFFLVTEPDSVSGQSTTNLQRVFRIPQSPEDDTPPSWGNLLTARDLVVNNLRFRMVNLTDDGSYVPAKIDFTNLDVLLKHLHARNIRVADSRITASLDSLSAREKSGFEIMGASAGKVKVGMGHVRVDDLKLTDGLSNISLKTIQLDGPLKNYPDFVDKIHINADIRPGTQVAMETVSYFGPIEPYMNFRGNVQGKVKGYVTDLSVKDIVANDLDHKFSVKTSGRIIGCTDIQNSALDFTVKEAKFTLKGLEGFIRTWAPDVDLGLDSFVPGELFTFEGTAKGPLNRLNVNGGLSSRLG
ncbi:MAG: hypothetical protein IJU21_03545, partial [Bacteroidales bacterium]|nr:hypothetical protein [Bacteroidales bacterium]